ncbi:hypothetical protein PHJA_002447400 [Phtheirospermum japonicum]|uniref:Uncharacterized protein n=1 Tax=Phtheirospermum japonicum TaxID=374723 RepID=A0A830D7C5_9LAMI|nr:hypothetical protein PHJA_002447400 [Phtheirospermum japonicum]
MALNQAIRRAASRVVPLAIRASTGSQRYHHLSSARDFGLGARGKPNPMRSAPSDHRSNYDPVIKRRLRRAAQSSSAGEPKNSNNSSNKASSVPVYDKTVYDEDIFDGLSGLKSKSAASTVRFEDDVFVTFRHHQPATGASPAAMNEENRRSNVNPLFSDVFDGQPKKINTQKIHSAYETLSPPENSFDVPSFYTRQLTSALLISTCSAHSHLHRDSPALKLSCSNCTSQPNLPLLPSHSHDTLFEINLCRRFH